MAPKILPKKTAILVQHGSDLETTSPTAPHPRRALGDNRCQICRKQLNSNSRVVRCSGTCATGSYCTGCAGLSPKDFKLWKDGDQNWFCGVCTSLSPNCDVSQSEPNTNSTSQLNLPCTDTTCVSCKRVLLIDTEIEARTCYFCKQIAALELKLSDAVLKITALENAHSMTAPASLDPRDAQPILSNCVNDYSTALKKGLNVVVTGTFCERTPCTLLAKIKVTSTPSNAKIIELAILMLKAYV